ncbi:hypothetical protein [Aurantiacibacter poecillastricola]|uniref:hypothetical protein n=1 Tax=Aurantiacibacter poecillastricola TaxID=3064385 RepID=UPI00273FA28A|nr:hypothetical protein [Aurantiacibacter sp. 219JJ12-13]MDP5260819.1 hypothetical protein [Aurantiacibacter sp. 219JJ12-13]
MTDQTGHDRYAGTTPPQRQSQSQAPASGSVMMSQKQQQGVQLDENEKQPPKSSDQYELNTPENMPHDEDDDARRQQAGKQSDHREDEMPKEGFGYGAEDGETMADAPDASERGYGGATERREEKVKDDK